MINHSPLGSRVKFIVETCIWRIIGWRSYKGIYKARDKGLRQNSWLKKHFWMSWRICQILQSLISFIRDPMFYLHWSTDMIFAWKNTSPMIWHPTCRCRHMRNKPLPPDSNLPLPWHPHSMQSIFSTLPHLFHGASWVILLSPNIRYFLWGPLVWE